MISRPLDLSSRLSQPPRDFEWLFFVNAGLIVLFFFLFGSRFVLAPGLGTDFRMPVMPEAREGAAATTHVISIKRGGFIFTDSGQLSLSQVRDWLKAAAHETKHPVLLMRASADVSYEDLVEIDTAAREAGFLGIVWGGETPFEGSSGSR
jgi:biopolymer transport protein ExbD